MHGAWFISWMYSNKIPWCSDVTINHKLMPCSQWVYGTAPRAPTSWHAPWTTVWSYKTNAARCQVQGTKAGNPQKHSQATSLKKQYIYINIYIACMQNLLACMSWVPSKKPAGSRKSWELGAASALPISMSNRPTLKPALFLNIYEWMNACMDELFNLSLTPLFACMCCPSKQLQELKLLWTPVEVGVPLHEEHLMHMHAFFNNI